MTLSSSLWPIDVGFDVRIQHMLVRLNEFPLRGTWSARASAWKSASPAPIRSRSRRAGPRRLLRGCVRDVDWPRCAMHTPG